MYAFPGYFRTLASRKQAVCVLDTGVPFRRQPANPISLLRIATTCRQQTSSLLRTILAPFVLLILLAAFLFRRKRQITKTGKLKRLRGWNLNHRGYKGKLAGWCTSRSWSGRSEDQSKCAGGLKRLKKAGLARSMRMI